MALIIDLVKARGKKAGLAPLPEGGEWRKIRGANVYMKDGKIIAGADGKLSDEPAKAVPAKKAKAKAEKPATKTKAKAEKPKATKAKAEKPATKPKAEKPKATKAKAEKPATKPKAKAEKPATKTKAKAEKPATKAKAEKPATKAKAKAEKPATKTKAKAEKPKVSTKAPNKPTKATKAKAEKTAVDKPMGANEEETMAMRKKKFGTIKSQRPVRDSEGNLVWEPVTDKKGKPVLDDNGKPLKRVKTEQDVDMTEEEMLREHKGLIIKEVVTKTAERWGLDRFQENWYDSEGNPTDLFGDIYQTANIGFMYGLREFAQKELKGEPIRVGALTHALQRAKDEVAKNMGKITHDIKIPKAIMSPLMQVNETTNDLTQKLGRKPTAEEVHNVLKDNISFNGKLEGVPEQGPERVAVLWKIARLQRADRYDALTGNNDRGDKQRAGKDDIRDESSEDKFLRREVEETQKELRNKLQEVFSEYLDERETDLIMLRFGIGTERRGLDDTLSMEKIAEKMAISVPLAKKVSASAMKKLQNVPPKVLAGLKALTVTKSLMKALYTDALEATLAQHGFALEDAETVFTRTISGTMDEITKALDTTEFIGAMAQAPGSDQFQARCFEYAPPAVSGMDLEKAQFGKKQGASERNEAIKKFVQNSGGKYKAMATTQRKEIEARKKPGKPLPWSVKLQHDNPGSCWITWHGKRILINGESGAVVFDRGNKAHQELAGLGSDEAPTDFQGFKWDGDEGSTALSSEMAEKREKFRGEFKRKPDGTIVVNAKSKQPEYAGNGFVDDWVKEHRDDFALTPNKKILKQFPSGEFMVENPETGKRVVMKVELKDAGTDKARTEVVYAFDPDADASVNIGSWKEIARQLEMDLPKGQNAYEVLRNRANTDGQPLLDVLSEEQYDELRKKTTRGAREDMVHTNFVDVTPKTMKITTRDAETNKFRSEEVDYKGNTIYETTLPNGQKARFEIRPDGTFSDPVMQTLINPMHPIRSANELYTALEGAINNTAWITVKSSKMDHLNHHVQLRYDGQGAPVVVGGAFDGYRFQDASEVKDPAEKAKSLFRGGKLVRTGMKRDKAVDVPFAEGNMAKMKVGRKWVDVKLQERRRGSDGTSWVVEQADGMVATISEKDLRHTMRRDALATEATVLDEGPNGSLRMTVPAQYRETFEANFEMALDANGRADISLAKYEEIRNQVGSFSLTNKANDMIEEYHKKKIREGMPDVEALREKYHPSKIAGFKADSEIDLTQVGLYNTQAEAIEHLLSAKKGIAGHGMGTGKTLIGVATALYARDQALKAGKQPKKTIIVSPAGIRSEWLKEINRHTEVGAVVLGGTADRGSKMGYDGLESEVVGVNDLGNRSEHFVVMSYEQYMKNAKKLQAQGYDNIIMDEVHAFKTKGGNRNKRLMEMSQSFDNVWALSGTPMDNNVNDIYHLVNAVTGGRHDLGTEAEFQSKYMLKQGTKIVGMKEEALPELGKRLAKYAQFRNGYSDRVNYMNGKTGQMETVVFPTVVGNPNLYHGTLSHVAEFEPTVAENGKKVNAPVNLTAQQAMFYEEYQALEKNTLSPAHRQQLENLAYSGQETGGSKNYLQGVQKLQQFANAPLSAKAYAKVTERLDKDGKKVQTTEYPHTVDSDGHKRYYKMNADGTDYARDSKGSPVLLPPMHHNNPKAQHLRKLLESQLAEHENEMNRRRTINSALKAGEKPMPLYPPKFVVTSGYTTFGAEVVENVFRDLSRDKNWKFGAFTGDTAGQRDNLKAGFQNDPDFPFMVISDAGKEGIDLGNAQALIHYDQDFNPNKMAQKSARILRSSSWRHAERDQRPNEVKLLSCVMPGTIEETIVDIQNRKMRDIQLVEGQVRRAEGIRTDSGELRYRAGAQRQWVRKSLLPLVIRLS